MAQNLRIALPEQDTLTLFDVSPEAATKIAGPNIVIAQNVGQVAKEADIIVTMLPEPKHVLAVYGEILGALKESSSSSTGGTGTGTETTETGGEKTEKKKIFIDSSTIDIETSLKVSKSIHAAQHRFVDAPVSGGTLGASNATLSFMVGIPADTDTTGTGTPDPTSFSNTVTQVLSTMGKRIVPCGGAGLGLAAKLSNNYILALTNMATSEAFQIAGSLGLDLTLFSEIVNCSTGRSWSSEVNNPVPGVLPNSPASRDYLNGFGVALMRKDLGLAIDAADMGKVPLLLGKVSYDAYKEVEEAKGEYFRNRDMSVIYKYLEEKKAA